jgi:cytochrome c
VRVFPTMTAAAATLCALALTACGKEPAPLHVAGGDAQTGRRLMEQYQCGSCHAIPDVAAARANTAPPLDHFGRRSYIAGAFPNLPDQLTEWLVNPPAMKPGTTMPNLGVSPGEARHMAAYLYTLR